MNIRFKNIEIRNAELSDAETLCNWWNDGAVMAHAGFPNGLGISVPEIEKDLEKENDFHRTFVILYENRPIGEMNYRRSDRQTAEIGIKICDFSMQNHGLGKQILCLFIRELFGRYGCEKIELNTNLKNLRAQHVYEEVGFQKVNTMFDDWADQLGRPQSTVFYELNPENFASKCEIFIPEDAQ